MDLLLVAFGAFFVAEFAKGLLPPLHPWTKALLALGGAAVTAGMVEGDALNVAALTLAGAGLGALVHKAHRLLSALGDGQQVAVMMKAQRRR